MLRKNLFGKNLYYAILQDKYGYDVFAVTATKTVHINSRTLNMKKTFQYKNLKELNELIATPTILNTFTDVYINEKKNGKIYTYHVLKTPKGFEFILDHSRPY
ncbi:MAG: hypothetical protein PHI91_02995 [Candidatus Pacebacteria bacterium]|nr:hypothetical protein [Candidatus Paceibacterota bacterium]